MGTIKIASWNAEWMNYWFTPDAEAPAFRTEFTQDNQVNNTPKTAKRAADLIRAVDPDILALQEAPSRREELDLFLNEYLSDDGLPSYQFFLGDSGGAQKLAVLYKPGSVESANLAVHADITMLIDPWTVDIDGDGLLNEYQFTRVPLVVNFVISGSDLQVVAQHTKSSFINNGKSKWGDPLQRQTFVVEALTARRRNSAECMRTRQYVETLLQTDPYSLVIILGDLNDGPGLDYFESQFLTHNLTDILVGSSFDPESLFHPAAKDVPPENRYTAIFDDFVPDVQKDKHMLLDHILLSPGLDPLIGNGLHRVSKSGKVCHQEYEAQVRNKGKKREDRPSDHRPVMVSLEF
jgi:hypothetical protein